MKKIYLLSLILFTISAFSQNINPVDWPDMTGFWEFNDEANIELATVGSNLELTGTQAFVQGTEVGDGATRIASGSYYKCIHGIASNGGGSGDYVNEYTLVYDFKIPSAGVYYSFFQTNQSNNNDAEIFINPSSHVGVSSTYYTSASIEVEQWYRLVVAVDLDNSFKYYVDGQLLLDGTSQAVDGRFSLDPFFLLFADDNAEDNEFDISTFAIFNRSLNDVEIESLGGFGHVFPQIPIAGTDPYLQSPTPSSIYISWHSTETSSTHVEYGINSAMEQNTDGSYEDISGKIWHTVKLENLLPNTEYFYRCISGNDTSEICNYKTINTIGSVGEHVRFVLLGDSRTDVYRTSEISQKAEEKLIELYGEDWHNDFNFVMHVGDVAETDFIERYQNEYFTPYSNLSKKIPFMVSVGNHEYVGQADNFFKYMKYEDLTGDPYNIPSSFNEMFYKFQIGNTLFISINSNSTMAVQEQTDWLVSVLDAAELDNSIDFIFPFQHHPGHSEIWPDGNTEFAQDEIIPILQNYSKISMLTYGHSHAYEKGVQPLDSANSNYSHDMYLMLSGGAGSELDRWGMYSNQEDYPEINMTLDYYIYSIVDIDCDNHSWNIKTYSLGNNNHVLDNELVDNFYCYLNQAKPNKPTAIGIVEQGTVNERLVASSFSGLDSLMTSQFQLTETVGDYSNPILDVTRDWQNIYGDTGTPDYTPINLNQDIILNSLNTNVYNLGDQEIYAWRVRYRDFNLKWSDWSDEALINDDSKVKPIVNIQNSILIKPNPVSDVAEISYFIKQNETVTIKIFDYTGRLVHVICENIEQTKGNYTFLWNSRLDKELKSGLFFCTFNFSGKIITKSIVYNP